MGKSNLIRNSVLILGALLAWQAIKDHRLKTARETRNDRYAMMEELWTDEQIEHVKESMRNVGKFLATSGIDNKCTVDHIGERQELLEGIFIIVTSRPLVSLQHGYQGSTDRKVSQRGPDADQRNFGKSGPRWTTEQENFQNADRGGPRTNEMKNRGLMNIKGK